MSCCGQKGGRQFCENELHRGWDSYEIVRRIHKAERNSQLPAHDWHFLAEPEGSRWTVGVEGVAHEFQVPLPPWGAERADLHWVGMDMTCGVVDMLGEGGGDSQGSMRWAKKG